MKLLLDTNVILDVLLDRHPHTTDSAKVMGAVESGKIDGSLCATTVTTIHYLASKTLGPGIAKERIGQLLQIFRIAPVTGAVLSAALQSNSPDYEDAVLAEAARLVGVGGIVTRNPSDFRKTGSTIYSPTDIVAMLEL